MTPETLEQVSILIRSAFYSKENLMEMLCEEMDELDPDEVSSAIDMEIDRLLTEQKTWPAVTDCDRLDRVFDALNDLGVVALQNAGYMQDDGYEEVWQAYPDAADDERSVGYCFYHGQDMEHAIQGDGLYLAFGPVDPKDRATKGPVVGRIVQQEFAKAGFPVEWDGTCKERILIPRFDWKRRLSDEIS